MNLKESYSKEDFISFLKNFLPDFKLDERPVSIQSKTPHIEKAVYLGESKKLDLKIFEFKHKGTQTKRVSLTTDGFRIMKESVSYRSLAVFYSEEDQNWRLSLMTASPEINKRGGVYIRLSNPRRYSFALGKDAKINTPSNLLLTKGRVIDFEDLQKRFSIEVVNKEFYKEIANLYTKLVGGVRGKGKDHKEFPGIIKLPSVPKESRLNQEFAVRMIGRIIFCWFLREKKSESGLSLISNDLLSLDASKKKSSYYHSVLELIFFELLNKTHNSRKEIYQGKPFKQIPYLNGGLFSPQDDDYYSSSDGKQAVNHNTLVIPDTWFHEFLEVLERYNFTIDENTTVDIDLSIDPEMLGRIFENLLAEINPETGESARKSTGSYYTPRTIVEYMVDESLFQYLKGKTSIEEAKLRALISFDLSDDEEFPFSATEKEKVVESLSAITMLDPACGSGAFPIGALQKIVFMLQKLDPNGQLWFQRQIEGATPEIRRIIEREFSHKNFDYIRKLGVIRESIFGVDIQPIATEIARLRCFLTLVVEERVDDNDENRGIEPLPNLDFKFVTANSLIRLPSSQQNGQVDLFEDQEGIDQLKEVRDEYFNASGPDRENLKTKFVQIQNKMFQKMITHHYHADLTGKLSAWNPFGHEVADWFDPDWMFGIKDGFDIVIANPPYGLINKKQNIHISITMDEKEFEELKKHYPDATGGMINIFRFFIIQSISLLKQGGSFCEIFPLSFTGDESMMKLRRSIFDTNKITSIEAFPERDNINKRVFQPVKMSVCIMTLIKDKGEEGFLIRTNNDRFVNYSKEKVLLSYADIRLFDPKNLSIPLIGTQDSKILKRVYAFTSRFNDFSRCYDGEVHLTKYKHCITDNKNDETLIKGAIIDRYIIRKKMSQGKIQFLNKTLYLSNNNGRKAQHHSNPRIIMQRITGVNEKARIKATIIDSGVFCANSIGYLILKSNSCDLKSILAVLNSKISNYIFKLFSTNSNVNGYEIENLPFPSITSKEVKNKLIELVDKILAITNNDDYPQTPIKQTQVEVYEKQIDQLVYKLYDLTPEEIKIVEGESLSE